MPPDQAYELMRDTLKALLPSLERIARTAKNPAARKKLMVQIQQIKDALAAAEEAFRRPKSWRQIVNSDPEPAASSGSAAS